MKEIKEKLEEIKKTIAMSEGKESLSSFTENKSQKLAREFDALLGSNVLVSPNEEQYDLLLKGLKQQLGEGRGEVILEVNIAYIPGHHQILNKNVKF